jgi:hypothetical protein
MNNCRTLHDAEYKVKDQASPSRPGSLPTDASVAAQHAKLGIAILFA